MAEAVVVVVRWWVWMWYQRCGDHAGDISGAVVVVEVAVMTWWLW